MPEIRNVNGRPAIYVDGKAYPPMMATIRTNAVDHMVIDKEYYRELGKAGIRIFFVICDTVWLKPNAMELFCEEAEIILEVVPDALIVPRIGLHPTNEWIKAHPEECCTYTDGSKPGVKDFFTESYVTDMPMHYSLCSDVWRRDAGEALAETWKMLMALPYADHIIGCFLAAGGTYEWYYKLPPVSGEKTLDHSEAFRRHFSRYLTEKYGTDEELQRQWKDPSTTLEHPTIPSYDKHYYVNTVDADSNVPKGRVLSNSDVPSPEGNGTSIGAICDFDANMAAYDFYRAWNLGTAESVLYFANIIKTMTPEKLVGAFYGAWGCTHFLNSGTCGGTVSILNSPDIDFLAAPGVYEYRRPGGFEGQREIQDSFTLHNKMYIIEQDTRTHMENAYFRNRYGIFDLTDSIDVMKREFGRNIAEDIQAWWFDQLLGGRRYKVPELYELISRQQEIAEEAYSLNRVKNAEIALIFDEESGQAVSQQSTRDMVEMLHNYEIARVGAPMDQYYHNDMADPNMPDYKLYIFVNTIVLTDAEREVIKAKLQKNNATAVWLWASGAINPDREKKFDVAHMSELTGFEIEFDPERRSPKFRIEPHAATARMQPRFVYGFLDRRREQALSNNFHFEPASFPAFYPTDGERAGTVAGFDKAALAVKEADGFTSIFHAAKSIRFDTMRSFADFAGCHIWCDSDDVTYIGRNYITIHAAEGGEKTLKFPKKCTAVEVYENKTYGEGVTEIRFDMYYGETKTFRMIWEEE